MLYRDCHRPARYGCALFVSTSLAGIDRFGSPLRPRQAAFAPRKLAADGQS